MVFFVVFGALKIRESYDTLPHAYARLRTDGVQTTATLVRCAPGIGGGHGIGCRLSLRYHGRVRTWNYPEDSRQFERLPAGSQVAVLADPDDLDTVYTVHDVDAKTNTGIGSPVLWFGVVLLGLGLAGLVWLVRLFALRPRIGG
jgi:hypothetical protein